MSRLVLTFLFIHTIYLLLLLCMNVFDLSWHSEITLEAVNDWLTVAQSSENTT